MYRVDAVQIHFGLVESHSLVCLGPEQTTGEIESNFGHILDEGTVAGQRRRR